MWRYFCSLPSNTHGGIDLSNFWASPCPPPRLRLFPGELLPFLSLKLWHVFVFLFLEWESISNLARLHTPPLDFSKPNTALDSFVSRPMCVSLRLLWGAPRAPRPLEYMILMDNPRLAAFEMNHVMRGMHEVARAS